MTPKSRFLHLAALLLLPTGLTHAETIASTDFDGRTVIGASNETATNLNWILNGVDDPGDLTSLRAGSAQALFNTTTLTQNLFAGAWNYGNNNGYWYTRVPLTVSAGSVVTLTDVTFNYVAINGGQAENVNRRADFIVKVFSPSAVELDSIANTDVMGGTAAGQPLVTSTFGAPIALGDPGTYIVEIQAGELAGANETGNHAGIDNLSINGTNGVDAAAPTPDPMTFAVPPAATGPASITMTAATATDDSGVEYLFTNTTLATDSGWQDGTEWTDTGLTAGSEYFYTVTARDKSPAQNATAPSTPVAATTDGIDTAAPTPDPMTFAVPPAAAGQFAISMTADTAADGSGVEYLFTNTTLATDSGWQDSPEWTDTGLTAATEYFYTVTARDKSPAQNTTAASGPAAATTDASDLFPPLPDPMTFAVPPTRVDNTSITMTATTATDESGVEYLFKNLTLATDSGWQSSPTWTDTGLAPDLTYEYTVTARDTSPSQLETAPSASASVNLVGVIAATSFDGQTISGNTVSNLNWILDGVEDPGDMSAFVQDTATSQNLFNSAPFNQNQFAPQMNTGNGNTWWRTSVDLTVSAGSAVTLTEVTFDYWAISGAGVQNVARRSDFTVTLHDPSDVVVGTASVVDVSNGASPGVPTAVVLTFPAPVELSAPGTYRLDIDGGELGGTDETGNHTGIDNLAIIGAAGPDTRPQITSITPIGDGLWELTLEGEPDTGYEFRSSTVMDFDPGTLVESLVEGGIPVGTITDGNVLTTDSNGDGTARMMLAGPAHFVRAQIPPPPPPLFSWDFETDGGGFTATGTPNDWAWGTPDSDNNAGLILTAGNGGSAGCWATNLGDGSVPVSGAINPAADSILRSPNLDLTGVTGAQLAFAAAFDTQTGDTIEVLIREVGTDAQLGSTIVPFTGPDFANWTDFGPFDLPAADGRNVYLEFRFQGTDTEYIGWYVDDVVITAP